MIISYVSNLHVKEKFRLQRQKKSLEMCLLHQISVTLFKLCIPSFFRQQHFLNDLEENDFDEVIEIMSNAHLNNNFLNLARELDIMDAKTPDDVYKSHLDNVRPVFGGGKIGFLTF